MAELRAARKCFNCGEEGHISRNCPTKHTVKSNTRKPPGIPSYSMEMEVLEDLSDTEEVLESVPVGYMGMAMNNEPLPVNIVNHVDCPGFGPGPSGPGSGPDRNNRSECPGQ